jgi:UDP:flavonoid glycosyltransferase YjiC (YdhE family)
MRVLFTTKSGAGHLGPLIPFARAFRRAGHDILVAAPREAAGMVRAEGLPLWAFDDPPAGERDAIFQEVRQRSDAQTAARVIGDIFARIDARAAYPGVLAACRAWAPDVVISEITEFAGPLAAEVTGAPSVCVGISQQGKTERVIPVVLDAVGELRERFGLRPDPAGARLLGRAYLTLMPAALEDPATRLQGHVERFREADLAVRRPLPDWWQDDERPLVYVTFGSVAPTIDELYPDVYRGALDALAGLPVRVLMTVGRDRDPAELGPAPANARVERWVAQNDVMPHAAAMVCHGGSGTVTLGLAAGVPMAVVPLFADQPWNAERVAALGAGIALEGGPAALGRLRGAVAALTGDPAYGAVARRVADEMAALPPVDAAVDLVADLLDDRIAA